MDYIATIHAEIEHHHNEIAKLEIALEVLGRMNPNGKAAKKPPQPLFTVRKVGAPALAAPGKTIGKRGDSTKPRVLEALAVSEQPMTSADLIRVLGLGGNGSKKQRVYGSVNVLLDEGKIERVEGTKAFRLVTQNLGVMGESPDADKPGEHEQAAEAA